MDAFEEKDFDIEFITRCNARYNTRYNNICIRSSPITALDHRYATINPQYFIYFYIRPGLKIAIPRHIPMKLANIIFRTVSSKGPSAAGYVRHGDILVPSSLDVAAAQALSEVSLLPACQRKF